MFRIALMLAFISTLSGCSLYYMPWQPIDNNDYSQPNKDPGAPVQYKIQPSTNQVIYQNPISKATIKEAKLPSVQKSVAIKKKQADKASLEKQVPNKKEIKSVPSETIVAQKEVKNESVMNSQEKIVIPVE